MPVPPHPALGQRAGCGTVQSGQCMRFDHMTTTNIRGRAAIGFGLHWHSPSVPPPEMAVIGADHPAHCGVMHHTHRMRIRDADRPKEITRFVDPVGSRHFAIAIKIEMLDPHGAWVFSPAARQDRGDADPDWAFAQLQRSFAFDRRGKSDLDARNIGNGIAWPEIIER